MTREACQKGHAVLNTGTHNPIIIHTLSQHDCGVLQNLGGVKLFFTAPGSLKPASLSKTTTYFDDITHATACSLWFCVAVVQPTRGKNHPDSTGGNLIGLSSLCPRNTHQVIKWCEPNSCSSRFWVRGSKLHLLPP